MGINVHEKILGDAQLAEAAAQLRAAGKRIVHCHGVFDLVHIGHIRHLTAARKHGDALFVTITADKHVKRGPGRPVFNEQLRAETLANLEVVDYVGIADYPTSMEMIHLIQPTFYAKGSDYRDQEKDVTGMIGEEEAAVKSHGGSLFITDDVTFSSSQLINLYLDTYPQATISYLKRLGSEFSADTVIDGLKKLSSMKILVIGDTIIDQYHRCATLGKSAKENLVAQRYIDEEDYAGGVLATANHLAELSHHVDLLTVLGDENTFEPFIRTHLSTNITPTFIHRKECVTIVKRRYISSHDNAKLFEICYLDDHPLIPEEEEQILSRLRETLPGYDLVVVSDFGHGMMTERIREEICRSAKCIALNVQTNSANWGFNLVTKYSRADLVSIDEREIRLAVHDNLSDLRTLIPQVAELMKARVVMVTRGGAGSISYSKDRGFLEAPAFARQGIDKVGAGDAFFAYVSPCFVAGLAEELYGFIGNAVGALKLQIIGNREPVRFVDLAKFITRLLKV